MRTESASPLETPAMSSLCESECGEGSSIGDVTTSSMGTGESEEETRPLLPGQGSLERIDTPNLEKVKGPEFSLSGSYESLPFVKKKGEGLQSGVLGVVGAALFIVGEMTGSGILGVPQGMAQAGYSGIGLMIVCVIVASYTGLTLARNWMHVRDQYPSCTKPYQSIGYTAYGKAGEVIVQICATVTLVGGCCAYLLIASNSLAKFIAKEFTHMSDFFGYRVCVIIVAILFLGVLMFAAGNESLYVAVGATLLSAIFSIIIMVGITQTGKSPTYHDYHITAKSWFLSFGKFLFAFGGHSAFPNFQKEMKKPKRFPISVLLAYSIKLCLYVPIGVMGIVYFGGDVHANILDNISEDLRVLNLVVLFIVAIQAIMSATILGAPVVTMIEGSLGITRTSQWWKYFLVKVGFVLLTLCVCEAIPRFDLIMALIGGTTINCAVFILPSLFHIKLAKKDKWIKLKYTLDISVIVFGVIAGVVCTFASVSHIIDDNK